MPNLEVNPKDSMAELDAKGAKVFEWIVIIAFIVFNIALPFLSSNYGGVIKEYPILWLGVVASIVWLIICIHEVVADKFWITQAKWPYILLLILVFVCWVSLGYCPKC